MHGSNPEQNPFSLDPSLKSLLTFKEQEKHQIPKEDYFERPHDRLYYAHKGATQYGLLKRLEEQAAGLADMRNNMAFNERPHSSLNTSGVNDGNRSRMSGTRKSTLPAINPQKKPSIKPHVKENQETLREFLDKGKNIFLEKMMVELKKEETNRLTEFIINEEETLNEHEADFKEHVKFSSTFIQTLNKDAEATFNESKKKSKLINEEYAKIVQLEQQIRTLETQIKKKEEEKETYLAFKEFFEELYEPSIKTLPKCSVKKETDAGKFFLTQKPGANEGVVQDAQEEGDAEAENTEELKFNNPKQMVELLKRIEEATIFLIHNTQEKEEDLERTRRAYDAQRDQIDEKFQNRKVSLNQLQKNFEKLEKEKIQAVEKLNRLKQFEKAPQHGENESVDIDKVRIRQKIFDMSMEIVGEKQTRDIATQISNSDEALKLMALLERDFEQLIKFYSGAKASEKNDKLVSIEKDLKRERRQANAKQVEELDAKKQQLAAMKQKSKKVVLRKGRRPMKKTYLETETETEEVEDEDANNDDEQRYFKENFVFMHTSQKNKNPSQEDG